MATLVREIKPILNPVQKLLFGIRHGQAWHNILYDEIGVQAFSKYRDTTLTAYGMQQAIEARPPQVDIVFVSPCLRTLQTASLMFPNTKKIAVECLKEYPQEFEICNRRSSKSVLERCFPDIDFSDLVYDEQDWPNLKTTHAQNKQRIQNIVSMRPETKIALVTHSTWLKYYMNNDLTNEPELKHCFAYPLKI